MMVALLLHRTMSYALALTSTHTEIPTSLSRVEDSGSLSQDASARQGPGWPQGT